MKNLFKNLMLVAVAAMAFTACSQDNNEVNNLTKKTSIDFIASIGDDTRSGFGDKVGDKYVSKWDGLENIIAVAHTDSGDVVAYTTIDEEGKGEFTAEFETNDVITRVDFYTPSYSWMTWGEIVANLPQTQKPRANSVDPSAHILRGSIEVVNNEAQGHVNFKHEFAYGKMTLNLPEDFKVETVNLAFNGVDEEYQKLELSADNVENNVFWFTTIPMNVATFTVEATAKNGAIATKEVTVDKAGDLVFEQGHVSTFSVSNLDISLYDYEVILTKVIAIKGNTISFEGENPQDRATIEFNTGLASIVAGTYSGVDASYGPGYSSNDALEFNYNGSTYNSSESYNSSYDMYFGSNDVVISDLGGDAIRVETIQEAWVSALNKSCRFRIFFEGALVVETPAAPMFTSAAWVNTSLSDKYVQFYSEELGTLQLNFYNANKDNSAAWLDARTYGFAMNQDIYPGGTYSFYVDTNGHSHYVTAGSVTVSVVDGEYYYIEFNNLTNSDGTFTLTATFKGSIENLSVPDTREKLAMPNATATADGNVINISWESVTGADEYYVFCYVGGLEAVTTKDTSVTIEAAYNTSYQFLIRAVAYDSNPDYKNSDDSYFSVTTEKDPNVFAQYIASNLYWDNSGYFVFVVDQYEIFRVKMNDADCPDHTTILEGEYTGIGSSTVPAKSFSVYQKVVGGFSEGWTSTKQTSTMSVSYVNGEYVIIVNYVGAYGGSGEVGYKGIPEGWVVPGSSSGDDNTDDSDDDNTSDSNMPGSESNPYEFTSVSKGQWDIQFTGADNGDRIVMDCNTTNVDSWIGDHGADTWIPMNTLLYGSGASIYGYNGTDYINSAFWGSSFVKVVKSGSTYTFTFNMSIDGGTTKTYYTYTGTL